MPWPGHPSFPCGALSALCAYALTYAAQPYSVTRLLAQGYEKLTGQPVTFRFGPGHVICSALIALPYWVELGIRFDGKHWRRCTPDDIGDHVQKVQRWEIVYQNAEG